MDIRQTCSIASQIQVHSRIFNERGYSPNIHAWIIQRRLTTVGLQRVITSTDVLQNIDSRNVALFLKNRLFCFIFKLPRQPYYINESLLSLQGTVINKECCKRKILCKTLLQFRQKSEDRACLENALQRVVKRGHQEHM